jgi:hypothetical protein
MNIDAIDQHVRVVIEDGGAAAVLELGPGLEPGALDEMTLLALVRTKGLRVTEALTGAIKEAVRVASDPGPQGVVRRVELARGVQPEHGESGWVEFLPGFDPREREKRLQSAADQGDGGDEDDGGDEGDGGGEGDGPKGEPGAADAELGVGLSSGVGPGAGGRGATELARVDHYSKGLFRLVRPGQRFGTLHAPIPGLDGQDVTGRTLPARQGLKLKLNTDDSVLVTPLGELFAQKAGVIEYAAPLLRVVQVIKIPGSIDFSTGHVDFPGSVVVGRSVGDCFRVTTARDLVVHGLVEAADVRAGRDAVFHGGVAGKEKGRITVARDCQCKYLNNADATIGRDLRVAKELVNSRVRVGRELLAPVASITGGCVTAGDRVEVSELGSEVGVATVLELGVIAELAEPIAQAEALLPQLVKQREKLQGQIEPLKKFAGKLRAGDAERLTELEYGLRRVLDRLAPLEQRLGRMRELLASRTSLDLTVFSRVHAKVRLVTPGYTVEFFKELRGPVRIMAKDREAEPLLNMPDGKPSGDLTHYARVRKLDALSAGATSSRAA